MGQCIYVLSHDHAFGAGLWEELTTQGREVCVFEHLDDLIASVPGRPPAALVLDGGPRTLIARDFASMFRPPPALTRALVAIIERVPSVVSARSPGIETFVLPGDYDRLITELLLASRGIDGPESAPPAEQNTSVPPPAASPPEPSIRIVVADPDRVVRQLISHHLTRSGWQVFEARDGEQAAAMINKVSPHAVVVDADLPMRNAFELMSDFNAGEGSETPRFFVISGQDENSGALRAFALGADDFVSKPVNPEVLVYRLSRFLPLLRRA